MKCRPWETRPWSDLDSGNWIEYRKMNYFIAILSDRRERVVHLENESFTTP